MAEIQPATDFMAAVISRSEIDVDEGTVFELRLTLTEAFANIVDHAYRNASGKEAGVSVSVDADELELVFTDQGRRPHPATLRSRNLEDYQERGLGLFLISRCMDRFEYFFRKDGTNMLTLTRQLAGRSEPPDDDERLPFHVAIYEANGGRVILPIGQFDETRANPFVSERLAGTLSVLIDLSYLHSIDGVSCDRMADYCREARSKGVGVSVACPSTVIQARIGEFDSGAEIASQGYARPYVVAGEETLPDPRASCASPVRGGGGRAYAAYMRRFMPATVEGRNVRLRSTMRWSRRTNGYFFRLIEPTASGNNRGGARSWLVIGCHSEPGWPAITASAELFGILDSFAANRESLGDFDPRSFVAKIAAAISGGHALASSHIRTMLVVIEFGLNVVSAWSGAGEPIASIGTTPLGAINIAGIDKLIMRSQDATSLALAGLEKGQYRIVVGNIAGEDKKRMLESRSVDEIAWPLSSDSIDCGMIEISLAGRFS